jgi:hypothetical protein
VNPGLLDLPGNAVDEDCSGADAVAGDFCDGEVDADSEAAEDAARALGLCVFPRSAARAWGVRSADWRRLADREGLEDPLQVGLPERFGVITPREGERLLVLSTGVARDVEDRAYTRECDVFSSINEVPYWTNGVAPPEGYPQDSSQCEEHGIPSEGTFAYNDVGLELELRIPTNVQSLSFDTMFFTSEYPGFVCTPYNDFFVVLAKPEGRDEANVLFDANEDTVGVNTALLSVCHEGPDDLPREISCEQGPDLLEGTGFDREESDCGGNEAREYGGASTGWLRTTMPVKPGGKLTLRFRLWDSGDPLLDSTALIDNFQFLAAPVEEPSTGPVTSGS